MYTQSEFNIAAIAQADIPEVLQFVMQARAQLFPKLSASGLPADLAGFKQVYLEGKGRFLVARDQGRVIASIGFLPYDQRFTQLDYRGLKVVEVVRLFVLPEFRCSGLAGALYRELQALALESEVEVMYLHTHPFLPGAIDFWHRQGFAVIDVEADPVWQTTHMQCRLW